MATVNVDQAGPPAEPAAPRPRAARARFFARTAWLMLAMIVSSFIFTYFLPMRTGSRHFAPVYHIHALAFFSWIGLYVWQTQLVANGRIARHRELGMAGIAVSSLMVPLGVIVAIDAIRRRIAAGDPAPFDLALYNVIDITSFTILSIAAFSSVTRRVEWHRRFIFGAALCLVGPAISRWFLPFPPLPPFTDFGPNILADMLLILLAFHDRRTLGSIHPATLCVIVGLMPIHLLTPFVTSSGWWRAIAPALLRLGS